MRRYVSVLTAALLAISITGCDVDVKDEGELPEVDVEGGRLPDVDARGPDVDLEMEEKTVTVPDVDVDIPEENENEPAAEPPEE